MKQILNRNRLRKLLGKKLEYSGKIEKRNSKHNTVLLTDVKHGSKVISDHIWLSDSTGLKAFDIGEEVWFCAIASTYIDTHGERKYGLRSAHRFHKKSDEYQAMKLDNLQKYRRVKK